MRKIIATSTIAASLLGTGFGAVALGPALAGAQDDPTPEVPAESDQVEATGLTAVLADLVTAGTLTQAQADTVEEAITSAAEDGRLGRHGHARGGLRGLRGAGEIFDELGLDADVVREGLADGMTLGEIADANGSSADAVAAALVENMQERLDAALEAGRIDEAEAAEKAAEFAERAEDIVNGEAELGRRGGFGRHRHGGPGPFYGAEATEDTAT